MRAVPASSKLISFLRKAGTAFSRGEKGRPSFPKRLFEEAGTVLFSSKNVRGKRGRYTGFHNVFGKEKASKGFFNESDEFKCFGAYLPGGLRADGCEHFTEAGCHDYLCSDLYNLYTRFTGDDL